MRRARGILKFIDPATGHRWYLGVALDSKMQGPDGEVRDLNEDEHRKWAETLKHGGLRVVADDLDGG